MMSVTVQLAIRQILPRNVLCIWLGNRTVHHAVGFVLGTTVFCLLALRSTRSFGEDAVAVVKNVRSWSRWHRARSRSDDRRSDRRDRPAPEAPTAGWVQQIDDEILFEEISPFSWVRQTDPIDAEYLQVLVSRAVKRGDPDTGLIQRHFPHRDRNIVGRVGQSRVVMLMLMRHAPAGLPRGSSAKPRRVSSSQRRSAEIRSA